MRLAIGILSSTALGLAVLAALVVYLGLASVLGQIAPDALERLTHWPAAKVYSHPLAVALWVVLCVNILLATVLRVRLTLASAGAWLSHLGVLTLAVAAAGYTWQAVRGQAIAMSHQGQWRPVTHFNVEGTYALWDAASDSGQTVLDDLPWGPGEHALGRTVNVAGVEVRLERFLPRAKLVVQWRQSDKDLAEPMAHVRIDGRDIVLSPLVDQPEAAIDEVLIVLVGDIDPQTLQSMKSSPPPSVGPMLVIALGPDIAPALLIYEADGTIRHAELEPGRQMNVKLGDRTFKLTPVKLLARAAMDLAVVPAGADEEGGPAMEVSVETFTGPRKLWLPFSHYGLTHDGELVELDGGRSMWLVFGPQRASLQAQLTVEGTARLGHHPGSAVPGDYVTTVAVSEEERTEHKTIRLNRPVSAGPYRVSHAAWLGEDDDGQPQAIIFGVASRPGLWLVWLGCVMIIAGMLWAFYVKPALLRRPQP